MSTSKKSNRWKLLALSLITLSLIVLILSRFDAQKTPEKAEVTKAPVIPTPAVHPKQRVAANRDSELAATKILTPEQQQIVDAAAQARKDVTELEAKVYATNALLRVAEEYRDVPRNWFENDRASQQALLEENPQAAQALRSLVKLLAAKEVMEDPRFRDLIEGALEGLPRELIGRIGSDIDKETDYTPIGNPAVVPDDKSGRFDYLLREINDRAPGVLSALEGKKEKYKVNDAFVEALKTKFSVESVMSFVDIYIGIHLPPELAEARRKARQLEIQASWIPWQSTRR